MCPEHPFDGTSSIYPGNKMSASFCWKYPYWAIEPSAIRDFWGQIGMTTPDEKREPFGISHSKHPSLSSSILPSRGLREQRWGSVRRVRLPCHLFVKCIWEVCVPSCCQPSHLLIPSNVKSSSTSVTLLSFMIADMSPWKRFLGDMWSLNRTKNSN